MKYKHVALAKELGQSITAIIGVKPVPMTAHHKSHRGCPENKHRPPS